MEKIVLTLTQDAYIAGYEGARLQLFDENGDCSGGLWDCWYKARAIDKNGNEYNVFWETRDDFNPAVDDDESFACDWDKPVMILGEDTGCRNLVNNVAIIL